MIACYLRVSTADQKHDAQERELKRWLKGNGHDLSQVKWYTDTEKGDAVDRPGLADLKKAVFHGEIKTVIVWKLDRLARSLREGINLVADWCEQGVRVVAITQQIDLNGTVGKILASVLFGFAEIELEAIRERRAAGIAAAKAQGIYKGRKSGTTKAKPGRAKDLRSKGYQVEEIAAAMAVSTRTIQRYLAAS